MRHIAIEEIGNDFSDHFQRERIARIRLYDALPCCIIAVQQSFTQEFLALLLAQAFDG